MSFTLHNWFIAGKVFVVFVIDIFVQVATVS